MHRHPNGIAQKSFYYKDVGQAVPKWVKTQNIYSESEDRSLNYILCQNQATLTYMNNLGCIEINPWNSRITKIDFPDYFVIDLDPSEKTLFDDVIEAALVVRDVLQKAGAEAYCKTSGASGLHIYVPLGAKYHYNVAKDFAKIIALLVNEQLPKTTTVERIVK